jgi:hypothetical protein
MALFQRIATAASDQLPRVGDSDVIAARDMAAFLDSAHRMRVDIVRIEAVRVSENSRPPT